MFVHYDTEPLPYRFCTFHKTTKPFTTRQPLLRKLPYPTRYDATLFFVQRPVWI